jgi:hypothetical protein
MAQADTDLGDSSQGDRCPSCGGSGVLRITALRYRTCLECVGQGALPRFESPGRLPASLLLGSRGWTGGFRGDLSAWTSGAR